MNEFIANPVLDREFDVERQKAIDYIKKQLISEVVVHGEDRINKNGERELVPTTDIDGRIAVYLLHLAGIEYETLSFVKKGDSKKGALNIDTSGKKGLSFDEETGTVYADHHTPKKMERSEDSSASEVIYRALLDGGLLPEGSWPEELIVLVNDLDNAEFPIDKHFLLTEWPKSFYGLFKALSFESLVGLVMGKKGDVTELTNEDEKNLKPEYFRRADHIFTDDELDNITVKDKKGRKLGLRKVVESQREYVLRNLKRENYLYDEEKPFVTRDNSERYDLNAEGIKRGNELLGKTLVNIVEGRKNLMQLGFTMARALGYDSYVLIDEVTGGFFVSCPSNIGPRVAELIQKRFPSANLIRGVMITYRPEPGEKVERGRVGNVLRTLYLL